MQASVCGGGGNAEILRNAARPSRGYFWRPRSLKVSATGSANAQCFAVAHIAFFMPLPRACNVCFAYLISLDCSLLGIGVDGRGRG